jgi:hypothetical protein
VNVIWQVAIFNDDSNTVELVASRGSGIYSYISNNTNIATVQPDGNASLASISPKRPGIVQVLKCQLSYATGDQ